MEYLLPALRVLHFFGIIMWLGSLLIEYLYLSVFVESDQPQPRAYALALVHRINKTLLNSGWILVLASGLAMLLIYGTEWLRYRYYMHLKLFLVLVAIGLTHAATGQFKKAFELHKKENGDNEKIYRDRIAKWKTFSVITITLLALVLILIVFRFGI